MATDKAYKDEGEKRVRAEIDQFYGSHKLESDEHQVYWVEEDGSLNLYIAKFFKISPNSKERTLLRQIYFSWDGKDIKSYEDSHRWLQDFIRGSQELRLRSFWNFVTSPLTIGGIIGILFTSSICVMLLTGKDANIPRELWPVLSAIIGFYFGRSGRSQNE
jgi:hypothetical protein